jgi:hypothetical protein
MHDWLRESALLPSKDGYPNKGHTHMPSTQPSNYFHMGSAIESAAQNLAGFPGAQRIGLLNSVYAAGAHGSARQSWIELARPLSTINLNAPFATQTGAPTATGANLVVPGTGLTVPLPIGMDIKNILCSVADIDVFQWGFVQLTFGTLVLVNPVSSPGPGSLAPFDPRMEHVDRVAPWIGAKTKVDVQCSAIVQNNFFGGNGIALGTGSVIFHGFSIQAYQEEQVCAIQTRIEPTGRNVGNYDIIAHLMHGYAAISQTAPQYPVNQPAAQTGSMISALPPFGGGGLMPAGWRPTT